MTFAAHVVQCGRKNLKKFRKKYNLVNNKIFLFIFKVPICIDLFENKGNN